MAIATIGAFIGGNWPNQYGWPELAVSVGSREFAGEFSKKLGREGVFHYLCDTDSLWQNGRTERAAGALKQQIALALEAFEPASPGEHSQLVSGCVLARNQRYNRSGFTPHLRVFGSTRRAPRSLCSDDLVDVDSMAWGRRANSRGRTTSGTVALNAHLEVDNKVKLLAPIRA